MMVSTVRSRRGIFCFLGICIEDPTSRGRYVLLRILHGAAPLKGYMGIWFRRGSTVVAG